jgi:hypothetical protein
MEKPKSQRTPGAQGIAQSQPAIKYRLSAEGILQSALGLLFGTCLPNRQGLGSQIFRPLAGIPQMAEIEAI